MNVRKVGSALIAVAMAVVVGSMVVAEPAKEAPKEAKAVGAPEIKLPPGWTEADMQKCVAAATPGKMQERLAQGAGVWQGKSTMWMGPGGEAMNSECKVTVTPIMDGRFVKVEVAGEMPGMGPYNAGGVYGFDNVSKKFVSAWIDNHSTGIMNGTGELSADGKTLTWNYNFNCPVTEKPAVLREVETITGADTKTLEMFGADPKSGKEYKMMRIELTKKKDGAAAAAKE